MITFGLIESRLNEKEPSNRRSEHPSPLGETNDRKGLQQA